MFAVGGSCKDSEQRAEYGLLICSPLPRSPITKTGHYDPRSPANECPNSHENRKHEQADHAMHECKQLIQPQFLCLNWTVCEAESISCPQQGDARSNKHPNSRPKANESRLPKSLANLIHGM